MRSLLGPGTRRSLVNYHIRAAAAFVAPAVQQRRASAMPPAAAAAAAAGAPAAEEARDAAAAAQMKGVTIVKPEEYESQLEAKVARVQQLFAGFDLPAVEVHRSAHIHYRQRAEFRRAAGPSRRVAHCKRLRVKRRI